MADAARKKEWRNKEYREVNNERDDYVATGSALISMSSKMNNGNLSRCSAVGSAPALGAGCREFESRHSDHLRMESLIQWFHTEFFFYRDSCL